MTASYVDHLAAKRIARAAELALSCPAAAELLRFYGLVAQAVPTGPPLTFLQSILTLATREAPAILAQSAQSLLETPARWQSVLDNPGIPAELFFSRAVRQRYAELEARRSPAPRSSVQPVCPFCGANPVVAILRPEGDGAKRSLLCSLCLTEWDFRRLLCPHCGEEDKDKLVIYTAEEFPHIRVEACDTCRTYIKSVDLTRNGLAVPEVDELASISLDLWAAENGYSKLQPNLFGL